MKEYNKINPEWLINIKKTGKLPDDVPFQQALENSLLYPAAGDDCRYIYFFTKFNETFGMLNITNFLRSSFDRKKFYYDNVDFFNDYKILRRHNHYYNINYFPQKTFESLLIDTFVYNDYLLCKKSPYNFDVNALLNTLSSKFKLLAEGYVDSYKIDIDISCKIAIYLTQNKIRIKDICKLYVQDSKKFKEIIANFNPEKDNRFSRLSFYISRDEPPFLHWSVWEDEETKKIFNLLYFSEESHVNLLRTYVKNKKTPRIVIFHRNGYSSHGCGWIDFLSYESPFIPMLMLNGVPDILICQHISSDIGNYEREIIFQLYTPINKIDFSEIVPENFVNVLNKPNFYNRDLILISNFFLEKLKSEFLIGLFFKIID
ncbi:MAG: hypothetical protein QXL18_05400 [Candidatus Woesearchaeota archaeon]